MLPSRFNLRVPIAETGDVFLMNTLTDAQLVVSPEVAALLEHPATPSAARSDEEREAFDLLEEHGFLVPDRECESRSLDEFFAGIRRDRSQMNVTILTTLKCNFACDYCYQGDRGDHNRFAETMSLETAARVIAWIHRELDDVMPERLGLTFFGGEPLLNLPVLFYLAEHAALAASERGIPLSISLITNGLLLTPDVVDRLLPYGLTSVKVTLDGDRDTHDRQRPLRGGQGTFDRIVANVRAVAGRVRIAIGGNFDASSAASYPALLEFLRAQEFADKLSRINFKPIVRDKPPPRHDTAAAVKSTCMTGASMCDTCSLSEDTVTFLREETRRRGFPTDDGVHMGPCQIHRDHAHTIGPDGSLYACPGFTGEKAMSTGHIDGRRDLFQQQRREMFGRLGPWKECGDCAFVPVCAGGCTVASHTELGDMNTPTCHKRSLQSALVSLAREAAGGG